MTIEEQNRMFLNLLARSMWEFPMWAAKRREEERSEADITGKGTNAAPLFDKQPDTSI